ncbi:hypothetical protein ABEP97_10095 [Cutibacterium acnes]
MALQEIEFTSRNRRDAIQAWAYEPVGTPAAVVQIIHGLGEHSRRYLHMISALLGRVSYIWSHWRMACRTVADL